MQKRDGVPIQTGFQQADFIRCAECRRASVLFTKSRHGLPYHLLFLFRKRHQYVGDGLAGDDHQYFRSSPGRDHDLPGCLQLRDCPVGSAQLVFITLPNVFEQLPFSSLWSLIFYILLAMAALTSTISLHEVVTAYIHEEFHMTRKKAAWLVSVGVFILGVSVHSRSGY